MEAESLISIFTSVGFPVAMCVALIWYMVKQNDKHDKQVQDLNKTIQNNTTVLTELSTLIRTLVK